jgi:hypothetical protein
MRNLIFIAIFFISTVKLLSQVSLSLTPTSAENICYHISIQNLSSKDIKLAGQNYRFYYEALGTKFKEDQLESYLPKEYNQLAVVQNLVGDATGYGFLPFEKNLGFVNLATDYHLSSSNPIIIGADGEVNIAKICFSGEINNNNIIWANEGLTEGYATAFNELSQLTEDGMLQKLDINEFKVNTLPLYSDMPVAFELGKQEKAIEINNNSTPVSLLSPKVKVDFKDHVFNFKTGRYVVLATVTESNIKNINLLDNCEYIENGKFVFKYLNGMEEAKAYQRRFINFGFDDANLFNVSEQGDLIKIKKQ